MWSAGMAIWPDSRTTYTGPWVICDSNTTAHHLTENNWQLCTLYEMKFPFIWRSRLQWVNYLHWSNHTCLQSAPLKTSQTTFFTPFWIFRVQELLHLVLVLLQFLNLCAGTLYRHPWNHHPCNLNNSWDNWRRLSWRSRRNSVTRLSEQINL